MSSITFTANDYVSGNVFRRKLPSTTDFTDQYVNVDTCAVYYSWYNISAALNNNTFQITMPLNTPITTTITLEDGAYNVSTLNNAIYNWFYSNGYYISNNTTGAITTYGTLQVSPSSYKIQWISYKIPTSLPSGYTAGSGFSTWPTSGNFPQLTVLSNNFGSLIGFSAGSYPASPSNTGIVNTSQSTSIPNVNPIYSIQLRLNCIYNPVASNSQALYSFTNQGVALGTLIQADPRFRQPRQCMGSYSDITLSLFDQSGNPIALLDPNICITISFSANGY